MVTGYIGTDSKILQKFLDSKGIKYEVLKNMLAVELRHSPDLFYLGCEYQQFLDKQKPPTFYYGVAIYQLEDCVVTSLDSAEFTSIDSAKSHIDFIYK